MGTWDYSIFWKETVNQLKSELSEQEYTMWFNMEYETSGEQSLVVSVPSGFYRDQVKQRYQGRIEEKLFELSGHHITVDFEIKQRARHEAAADSTAQGTAQSSSNAPEDRAKKTASSNSIQASSRAAEQKERGNHPLLRED
ncbi:MAG TPA: DnaA N-terminal domain-containing protein, partial [Treponemataceae bacterium]|nr:DnaA N-terminal domain-containing protein [Treponemataceae bacterium]